jgi:hypothetical protein
MAIVVEVEVQDMAIVVEVEKVLMIHRKAKIMLGCFPVVEHTAVEQVLL